MTFYEQQFSLGINYGAVFSIRHSTAIAQQSNGLEQRRIMWSQPLVLANLARKNLTQTELDNIIAFHNTVKGSAIGFRLKDWSDYKATTAIGTGDGSIQTWQLFKRYSIGAASVTRPITKPVANSLTLYLDGVETAAGWSVDTTTGVLTTELTGAITVEFEFDVPVRFEQDQIDFTFLAGTTGRLYELADLTCTEIRIEPSLYPTLDTLPDILDSFNLGYDFRTTGGPSFSTKIIATASEFESRKSYWDTALGTWNVGDRTLTRTELDYFIAFFRCARGMAIPFLFFDWQSNESKTVRFAEDRIGFQFNAYQSSDEQVIFNLGGAAIGEIDTSLLPSCRISAPYFASLSVPLSSGDQPRQTITATFNLSDYRGDLLPVVNNSFVLDDLAFFVKPGFDVTTAYAVDGSGNRTIYLPDESLVVVDGNLVPPQYGNGHVTDSRDNTYIYKMQSFTIPASTGELVPLSDAINGLIGIGVSVQPHNQISLSQLKSLGFVTNNEVSFKIMHVAHGLGEITLQIDVPQC